MESFMHQTWWLYDLTVLAVLILCIWGGWRRGLISSVAGLLGYAAAALLAGVLAQPAAEYVYDRWLAEPCAAILEQKMEQYHLADDLQQTLGNYGIQLDDAALQQIADNPDNASEELYSVVSQKTGLPAELLQQGLSQSIDSASSQLFTEMPSWMHEAILPQQSSQELQNRTVQAAALVVLPALAAAFCLSKPMSAYQMGEAYAQSVGVNVKRFSRLLVLLSSLLAACVTAFAGPISFVGIAVPHLVKQLLGSAKPLVVLPGCCLGGAAFCLLCDLIARSLFAPTELSISAVTAVFGAPVVIGLLIRRNREGAQ